MSENYRRILLPAAVATLTAASAALLSGCKGNTTSAATSGNGAPSPPPIVMADRAPTSPLKADPLTDPQWLHADWAAFTAPANAARTTAPTRAAVLYDAANLYVAAICDNPASLHDQLAVFLDTTATGKEFIEITVDQAGQPAATWYRAAVAPTPHDDGSPNFAFPMGKIPDVSVPGMTAQVGAGQFQGRPAWTLVLAIPLKALPVPLIATPTPGAHWKLNILRTLAAPSSTTASGSETLQSNLSSVYLGAQRVAPYRMAELNLRPAGDPPAAPAGNNSSISRTGKSW
jgi:hypothetical protein